MLHGLGADFEGAKVSFKPWPSCRGTHAFVEAALVASCGKQRCRCRAYRAHRREGQPVLCGPVRAAGAEAPAEDRDRCEILDPVHGRGRAGQGDVALAGFFAANGSTIRSCTRIADRSSHGRAGLDRSNNRRGARYRCRLRTGARCTREVIDPLGHPLQSDGRRRFAGANSRIVSPSAQHPLRCVRRCRAA